MYHGDIRLGDTIDIKFTTVQTTGASFTLAGSPVISAYPANSTTQLTAGITLSVDFDSVTGLNNVRVVASSGNGYLTATNYALVITTGTVNSVSVVGYTIGTFSIENRSALMPTTAARTVVIDVAGLADANIVKVGPTGSGVAQTAGDVGIKTGFRLSSTGVADVWDELTAGHTTANSFGYKFGKHLPAILVGLTTAGSDTTHVVMNASTGIDGAAPSATNDFYNGAVLIFTSGAMAGQRTSVTAYVGSTQTLTVTAVTGSAASGVSFILV